MYYASNPGLQAPRCTTADRENSPRTRRTRNTSSAGRGAVTCTCHIALALAARCSSVLANRDTTGVNFRGQPVALGWWSRGGRSGRVDGVARADETRPTASSARVVASSRDGSGSFGAMDRVMRRDYAAIEIAKMWWGRLRSSGYSVDAGALELCRGGAFEGDYGDEDGGEGAGEDSGYDTEDDAGNDEDDDNDYYDGGSNENYDTDEEMVGASEASDDNSCDYSQDQQYQDEDDDGDDEYDFTTDAELELAEDGHEEVDSGERKMSLQVSHIGLVSYSNNRFLSYSKVCRSTPPTVCYLIA